MNIDEHVELNRTFSPVYKTEKDAEDYDDTTRIGRRQKIDWTHVDESHCAIILAGSGIGKTHEMKHRAEMKRKAGVEAFFIRIEDIDKNFTLSFEVGDEVAFETWALSVDKAWFYLDSIDEARLNNPRIFEKAINCFARKIKHVQHQAHIVISSRPYAWRSHTDRMMIEKYLPQAKQYGLHVFDLNDLTEIDIRIFSKARGIVDENVLVENIKRQNLFAVAARPFELENIIEKWKKDGKLGSRLEFLRFAINNRLSEINPDRDRQQPLNIKKAHAGSRLLAAAVILTGKLGIKIPEEKPLQNGINASGFLKDWEPNDVHALLERGIFDGVLYSKVRFRHREFLELLAAEWFYDLLQVGNSRKEIENLIFREKYGHHFISTRLRPIIPWLMLWDVSIYEKAISIEPGIIMEGGDPSQLSYEKRQKLLDKIVVGIAHDCNPRSFRNIGSTIGISSSDLSDDVLQLIDKYPDDDSVLFFLGKMAWQGEMKSCVKSMVKIVLDINKSNATRIIAIRVVSSIGKRKDFNAIWDNLISGANPVSREIASEIIDNALPDHTSIIRLISMIGNLEPFDQFRITGFSIATQEFFDRFDINKSGIQCEMAKLIRSLANISLQDKNTWLLGIIVHVICDLINVQSPYVISKSTIDVLHKISSCSHWYDNDIIEYKERLRKNVPEFSRLNDFVFWSAVSQRDTYLNTDSYYQWDLIQIFHNNFCFYRKSDFNHVLSFISHQDHDNNKLIAITLAYSLIKNDNFCDENIIKIRDVIKDNENLIEHFEGLINWEISKKQKNQNKELSERRQERERKNKEKMEQRSYWVNDLKSNPDRISYSTNIKPGKITSVQRQLMQEIKNNSHSRSVGNEWEDLIETFGLEVAEAYRDASIEHWRHYNPPLASEGNNTRYISDNLIFGLSGLEMEARKISDFPKKLTDDQLRHAMRYVTYELRRLPTWVKRAYDNRPEIVSHALLLELEWEISQEKISGNHILQDLVYDAPWIHEYIAEWIITWLEKNSVRDLNVLRKLIFIAKSTIDVPRLLNLARNKLETQIPIDEKAKWFALCVDINADESIGHLDKWLNSLSPVSASIAAQHFITELIGDDIGIDLTTSFNTYQTIAHSKYLFEIMLRYICKKEDIDRANCEAYIPDVRDSAQRARDSLFEDLCNTPGKESYLAIKELAENNQDKQSCTWMSRMASNRAEEDGDIDYLSEQQLQNFNENQVMIPKTNDQLFLVAVNQLLDIKDWLENGDDSEYKTWQKATSESEIRNLFTSHLNILSKGRYDCSQENELPNAQQPDIWIQKPGITSIPIEIKLLDKYWSGPKLCERLRNQLAGDYLRDKDGGRGIMLLVSQKCKPDRKWKINRRMVNLENLEDALQGYWEAVASDYHNVEKIKIIVVNLMQREKRSNT